MAEGESKYPKITRNRLFALLAVIGGLVVILVAAFFGLSDEAVVEIVKTLKGA